MKENTPEEWDRLHQANVLYERLLKVIAGHDLDIIDLAIAKLEFDLYGDNPIEEIDGYDEHPRLNGYHG